MDLGYARRLPMTPEQVRKRSDAEARQRHKSEKYAAMQAAARRTTPNAVLPQKLLGNTSNVLSVPAVAADATMSPAYSSGTAVKRAAIAGDV